MSKRESVCQHLCYKYAACAGERPGINERRGAGARERVGIRGDRRRRDVVSVFTVPLCYTRAIIMVRPCRTAGTGPTHRVLFRWRPGGPLQRY